MEIIHIILGKANPERMNGVNKVVYQLASKQAAAGIKVSVWGITDTLERNYPERNFETLLFKKSMNPFHLNEQLKIEILKKNSQTIFHLHGGWLPLYSSLGNFLSGNKRKFLITAHGAYNTIAMQKSHYLKKYTSIFLKKNFLKMQAEFTVLETQKLMDSRICMKITKRYSFLTVLILKT
ncbi:hypothetical protein H5J24_09535 [Chryseobacterium capnotolerans]|uniref:glycosyltransferase family 4 protein n=1 Tax=Chryseobacterium capnotolerans TaxID=2759528 RepID=UPI001E432592|nr:glycosyltransferase family 4 protein [Chryseobacterium capnotolerans]UHO40207.1 hypothetical protein H5J24_09535 [Chryseobacterium capnotolerans]